MPYLIITFAILLAVTVALFISNLLQRKYDKFVIQNSQRIKSLQALNSRYKFFDHVGFDQSHTYDNENFYGDISCEDYLIYQLQFISQKVVDQINKEKRNKRLYSEYLTQVGTLTQKGVFLSEIGKLKYAKLLAREERMFKKHTYAQPPTDFKIKVTLYCSTINGRIYYRKSEIFKDEEIFALVRRLRNRNGIFYNDREIWNSISRVERGKVSNKIRFAIYERDGYRCRRCGASQRYTALEIDHIIPIAKGGKSTYNNLQTLCHKCNVNKGDRLDF